MAEDEVPPATDTPAMDASPAIDLAETGASISLPLDPFLAFPGVDPAEISVLIVGGLGRGIALSAGVDNGDGTATLLAQDVSPEAGLRMRFPAGATGPHTFAITAISNDGHVKTGSLTMEPGLASVEDNLVFEVEAPVSLDEGRRAGFPLAIGFAAGLNRMVGDLELTLGGIPRAVHPTGGAPLGDGRWRLMDADLAGLSLVVPAGQGPFQAILIADARGQSGGRILVERRVLVGLAGRSVLDPAIGAAPPTQPEPPAAPPVVAARTAPLAPPPAPAPAAPPPMPDSPPPTPSAAMPPPAATAPAAAQAAAAAPELPDLPAQPTDWLTGTGVFTFASGHGGDLFEGGYGWFDRPTAPPATADGEEPVRLRVLASGPVIEGPEPIVW